MPSSLNKLGLLVLFLAFASITFSGCLDIQEGNNEKEACWHAWENDVHKIPDEYEANASIKEIGIGFGQYCVITECARNGECRDITENYLFKKTSGAWYK